tara:strand:- start:521 stop:715 length:195 start_codon:yes stop_codon:yes gene_type:complete
MKSMTKIQVGIIVITLKIKVMTNLASKILANDNYDEVMLACKLSKLKFKLELFKIKNQKYESLS